MAEKETVQALFYIEPKEAHNRVQHIGCRLILTEKLIRAGFTKGGVFNLPDGRVEVLIEGNKEDIETFYREVCENLVAWLEEKTDNKERLKQMIGNPGINFSQLEIKQSLRVLDIGLFSHSLELNQLEKGVDVYYNLTEAFKENSAAYGELKNTIEGLNKLIDKKVK